MTADICDSNKKRLRTSGIDRALQILDFLQEKQRSATSYEMAKAIDAPLSTIYAVVEDMVNKSLLERQNKGLIWFGPRLYYYGLTYSRHLDMMTIAIQEMGQLAACCGEVVQVCGRDNDTMVVLAMSEGRDHFQMSSRVGTRSPLNWSASGRLLVGHLPARERLALFELSAQPSPTGRAETNPRILADSAYLALQQRLSVQAGESDFAIACIAAPVCDLTGACLITLSIVVSSNKLDQPSPDLRRLVQKSAENVENRLGWCRSL